VTDSISIDKLKKSMTQYTTLKQYFKATFKYSGVSAPEEDHRRTISGSVSQGLQAMHPIQRLNARKGKKRYAQARTCFL